MIEIEKNVIEVNNDLVQCQKHLVEKTTQLQDREDKVVRLQGELDRLTLLVRLSTQQSADAVAAKDEAEKTAISINEQLLDAQTQVERLTLECNSMTSRLEKRVTDACLLEDKLEHIQIQFELVSMRLMETYQRNDEKESEMSCKLEALDGELRRMTEFVDSIVHEKDVLKTGFEDEIEQMQRTINHITTSRQYLTGPL